MDNTFSNIRLLTLAEAAQLAEKHGAPAPRPLSADEIASALRTDAPLAGPRPCSTHGVPVHALTSLPWTLATAQEATVLVLGLPPVDSAAPPSLITDSARLALCCRRLVRALR